MMDKILPMLGVVVIAAGCAEQSGLPLPNAGEVETYYEVDAALEAQVVGNVATVRIAQDPTLIRRGGALWAKVGPYIYLFSEETHQLFLDYPGLAGVRFVTYVGDADVASALLERAELSDVLWRRAKNIAGQARRDGSSRVTLLEDLVEWGEDHTEYEYNSRFTRR